MQVAAARASSERCTKRRNLRRVMHENVSGKFALRSAASRRERSTQQAPARMFLSWSFYPEARHDSRSVTASARASGPTSV